MEGELTGASGRDVNVHNAGYDAGGEVLTLGRVVDIYSANTAALLAAAVAKDGKLGEARLTRLHVCGQGAGGRGENGHEGDDGELHVEGVRGWMTALERSWEGYIDEEGVRGSMCCSDGFP